MTMSETIEALSADAKSALLAAKGEYIGALVPPSKAVVDIELFEAGLLGGNGGLTIRGSGIVMKLKAAQERELFPL